MLNVLFALIGVALVPPPFSWCIEEYDQHRAFSRVQRNAVDEIVNQDIYLRVPDLKPPFRFDHRRIYGRGLEYSNIGETLQRNELTERIKYLGLPSARKPYDIYLRLERTRAGRPATTWYHALAKICENHICPYEEQKFEETTPLSKELQQVITYNFSETPRDSGFTFQVTYQIFRNGEYDIISAYATINAYPVTPLGKLWYDWDPQRYYYDWGIQYPEGLSGSD